MQGRRIDRIEEQLRIELSEIVEREIQDPRIGLATVTAVKVSPDLAHARVFVSVLGDQTQRKKTLEGLRSAANFVRRSLSRTHKIDLCINIRQVLFFERYFERDRRIFHRKPLGLDQSVAP